MDHQSEQSDEEIIKAIQAGDTELFGTIVVRYEQRMMRYAQRFLFGYTDAQDVVQDVFIKAYTNIQGFDTKRKFSSWIYRIAHNEFINAIKKKGKEPLPFFDPDTLFPHPVSNERTDRHVLESELKVALDESLGQLDPKYREPLVLFYYEEMDYQTIAEILKIPKSTVGVRINRGKKALNKIYIEKYGT